jgi:biopolymer transport protein ExbD
MKKLSDAIQAEEEKLDLTPLIDVIFMLLLFFVVTTTFAEDTFFPIELSGARNAESAEVLDLASTAIVEISREGELAMGREFVPSTMDLYQKLRDLSSAGVLEAVAIKADAESPSHYTVEVLDVLRELGIENFAITTQSSP